MTISLSFRTVRPWRAYFLFLGAFLLVFLPVYVGSGYLSSTMPERALRLYLDWETSIPLVPWMVWPYLSLYTVYLLPLLHLDAAHLRRLTLQNLLAVLAGGAVFLLFPARAGFAPTAPDGLHGPLLRLIAAVDTRFNLVPSLHVTCAALILFACARSAPRPLQFLYGTWMALLAASTVLVHQHHLLDVVAGLVLAATVRLVIPITPRGAAAR